MGVLVSVTDYFKQKYNIARLDGVKLSSRIRTQRTSEAPNRAVAVDPVNLYRVVIGTRQEIPNVSAPKGQLAHTIDNHDNDDDDSLEALSKNIPVSEYEYLFGGSSSLAF